MRALWRRGIWTSIAVAACLVVLGLAVKLFVWETACIHPKWKPDEPEVVKTCIWNAAMGLRSAFINEKIPDGYNEEDAERVVAWLMRNGWILPDANTMERSKQFTLVRLKGDMGFVLLSPNGVRDFEQLVLALRGSSERNGVWNLLRNASPPILAPPHMAKVVTGKVIRFGEGALAYWYDPERDK